ncbi:MAG: ECF transporter S component [Clostridia bacterium]|nr:ECF transporter S component [Clostridia bacterium]
MKNRIRKVIISAMFAAIACVATMIIKIPSLLNGYINLGDCIVLLCGWVMSPLYAFIAAGVGSALADALSGYFIYVPATFFIKGIMAVAAYYIFKLLTGKLAPLMSRIVSGVISEIIMVLGYFIFEGFLYGFIPSAVNIGPNIIQGVAGLILGIIIIKIFEKKNIFRQ